MKKQCKPLQIGRINYTNAWPIFHHFSEQSFNGEVELVSKVPSELNHSLAHGSLDLAAISSFSYGQFHKDYLLFPDLSVSSFGKVNSILLFMKKPLKDVLNGTIAVTTASATSVNLLKIIVEKFHGGHPTYIAMAPSLQDMLKDTDAALLIGDDAIRASWTEHEYEVMDLGEAWYSLTGQGMTFAVWALRRSAVEQRFKQITDVYEAFQQSKVQSLTDLQPLIEKAVHIIGGTKDYWFAYFRGLNYDFGQSHWNGLQLYFQYAKELGLIDHDVPLQIWSDNSVVQVNS